MVQLTETSLSKRQQELNNKINELVTSNVIFDEVESEPETSDIDRLFKIDIAAKYKKIDYIFKALKSGDSLCVSRVLKKCSWLYGDEYSTTINPVHLSQHIFPFMSLKMQKKFLTAISVHLKNSDRSVEFHKYCLRMNMYNLAEKFLITTSESYKLNIMQETKDCIPIKCIGNSFTLFEKLLAVYNCNKNDILSDGSYLYSVSDVKYLDLLERYAKISSYQNLKFGLRTSKDIMTKHKDRVLAKPKLYLNILNMTKLLRHSTLSDVKLYAIGLLPKKVSQFWIKEYYQKYKPIIHAIPEYERYAFIKKIFTDNYINNEFETTKAFYDQGYYNLMTEGERERWALDQIASNKEILGSGLDYCWYKFINFEKGFVEIKKLMMTATDAQYRLELLSILVQSAKSQRDLERLLKYFYERHVNEKKYQKELFVNILLSVHDVFEFDEGCWDALNKIFYSLDVYAMINTQCNPGFKVISILYHIINKKDMPEGLIKHAETEISMYSTKKYVDKLSEERKLNVYTYIIQFYLDRITKFVPGSENDKCKAHIHFTLEFLAIYEKTKEDIPKAIMEFINHDFKSYRYQQILENKQEKHLTENDLIRDLKKDSNLVANKTSEVRDQIIHNYNFRLNQLLKKMKIYFSEDNVTQQYLKLFENSLNDKNISRTLVATAVLGIFQLSNEQAKIDFMNKFAPHSPKIDRSGDTNVLMTQEAICRFACYSRPSVPLPTILKYLKGDYVQYCLPMFNMYLSNLPQNLCLKFVESLLDAPVSIQKHGLRLAFKCFSTEYLKNLVLTTWKKTKNVSIRDVIYQAFFKKAVTEQDRDMYKTLIVMTLDLHDYDKPELFELILSIKLASDFAGDFFEALWAAVRKYKDTDINIERKTKVIKHIDEHIHSIKKETVKEIVNEHLNDMFSTTETNDATLKSISFHLATWNLVARYLVHFTDSEEDRREGTEMVKLIMSKVVEGWNNVVSDIYVFRQICVEFITNLKNLKFIPHPTVSGTVLADRKSYVNSIGVFEAILKLLQESLPLHEIYSFVWDLRITIVNRQVVNDTRVYVESENRVEVIVEAATEFGRRLGHLVKEFIKNKTYFSHFTEEITKLAVDSAWAMKSYLEHGVELETEQMLVGIARGLLEVETTEASLLALRILPLEPKCDVDSFKSVYNTIRKLPEMEVQCSLHRKFSGDCKRRRCE